MCRKCEWNNRVTWKEMCNHSKRSTHLFLGDLEIVPGKLASIEVLRNVIIYALNPNQDSSTLNVLILPIKSNTTYRVQKFLQLCHGLPFFWSDILLFPMWHLTEQILFLKFYFTVFPLPCASLCQMSKGKLVLQWHSGLCIQMIPWEKNSGSLMTFKLTPNVEWGLSCSWKRKHKNLLYTLQQHFQPRVCFFLCKNPFKNTKNNSSFKKLSLQWV